MLKLYCISNFQRPNETGPIQHPGVLLLKPRLTDWCPARVPRGVGYLTLTLKRGGFVCVCVRLPWSMAPSLFARETSSGRRRAEGRIRSMPMPPLSAFSSYLGSQLWWCMRTACGFTAMTSHAPSSPFNSPNRGVSLARARGSRRRRRGARGGGCG